MGSIWKGKTTPSVDRTPPAAADDLKHPNRSPTERVRFGKGRRSQHSAVFAVRRKRNGVCSLIEPNRSPMKWVRFGKEKQHHRSIGRRLRRLMTLWCCFDAGTPARARTGDLGLRRLALYPTELQTHTVYVRRNCAIVILSLDVRCCQGGIPSAAARLFQEKALQSYSSCDILGLHG